jgi:hypothetical protein
VSRGAAPCIIEVTLGQQLCLILLYCDAKSMGKLYKVIKYFGLHGNSGGDMSVKRFKELDLVCRFT